MLGLLNAAAGRVAVGCCGVMGAWGCSGGSRDDSPPGGPSPDSGVEVDSAAPVDSGEACDSGHLPSPEVEWAAHDLTLDDPYEAERCLPPMTTLGASGVGPVWFRTGDTCENGERADAYTLMVYRDEPSPALVYRLEQPHSSLDGEFSFLADGERESLLVVNSLPDISGVRGTWIIDGETLEERWEVTPTPEYDRDEYDVSVAGATDRSAILQTLGTERQGLLWVFDGLPDGEYDLGEATAIHEGIAYDDQIGSNFWDIGDLNADGLHELALLINGAVYVLDGADLLVDMGVLNARLAWADLGYTGDWGVTGAGDLDGDGYSEFAVNRQGMRATQDEGDLVVLDADLEHVASVAPDYTSVYSLYARHLGDVDGDGLPEALLRGDPIDGTRTDAYFVAHLPACGSAELADVAVPLDLSPFEAASEHGELDAAGGAILIQEYEGDEAPWPAWMLTPG